MFTEGLPERKTENRGWSTICTKNKMLQESSKMGTFNNPVNLLQASHTIFQIYNRLHLGVPTKYLLFSINQLINHLFQKTRSL